MKFKVGDIVTCIHRSGNGTGEGVLWRVAKIPLKGTWLKIDPIYTVTGRSSLKSKKVQDFNVELFGMGRIGEALTELAELAQKLLRLNAGLPEEPTEDERAENTD